MLNRLDFSLVQKNMTTSRERAKELIKNKQVFVNDKLCTKASFAVDDEDKIEVKGETLKYVGRGGLKLEKAINVFNLNLSDLTCMDIGASTGGFTDCMLQNGAKKIYAVDVGHDQLVEKLRNDHRVVNLEGTNIRNFDKVCLESEIDFISIDVSFISLKLVLPKAVEILSEHGGMVALIKPQFETNGKGLGKHGIVKDKKTHISILNDILTFTNELISVTALDFSAVTGGDGNIEYIMHCVRNKDKSVIDISKIVNDAFSELRGVK